MVTVILMYANVPTASMDCGVLRMQPSWPGVAQCSPQTLTPRCSDNSLVFLCEFHQLPGPPPLSDMDDTPGTLSGPEVDPTSPEIWRSSPRFGPSGSEFVVVTLPAQCSVHQLRLRIYVQVGKIGKVGGRDGGGGGGGGGGRVKE